jgi:hypothetical protein
LRITLNISWRSQVGLARSSARVWCGLAANAGDEISNTRLAVSGTAFLIIEITSALERDDLVQRLQVAHANIDVAAVGNRNTSGAPILGEVMVIPSVLNREIVSVRPDEAPSSAPSGRSGCFILEVGRRRAQTTKFFFMSEAALARGGDRQRTKTKSLYVVVLASLMSCVSSQAQQVIANETTEDMLSAQIRSLGLV